jgi:hypothetical protein
VQGDRRMRRLECGCIYRYERYATRQVKMCPAHYREQTPDVRSWSPAKSVLVGCAPLWFLLAIALLAWLFHQ